MLPVAVTMPVVIRFPPVMLPVTETVVFSDSSVKLSLVLMNAVRKESPCPSLAVSPTLIICCVICFDPSAVFTKTFGLQLSASLLLNTPNWSNR